MSGGEQSVETAHALDRLRAAETLVRERATAVDYPSPWSIGGGTCGIRCNDGRNHVASTYGGVGREEAAAQHIATWHPAAALAVADVLHQAAMDVWAHGPLCECGTGCDACDDNQWEAPARAALALADALLPPASAEDGERA